MLTWVRAAALATVVSILGCDTEPSASQVSGTPDEGDVVVGQLRSQYSVAQSLAVPAAMARVIGRRMRCNAFDARSYAEPNHGANSLTFDLTIYRGAGGLYQVRYDWHSDGQWYQDIVTAGIDHDGFAVTGFTSGACAGIPIVHRMRRLTDDGVVIESTAMGRCGVGPARSTTSVSHPEHEAIRYATCH